ncbi:MAG: hypothetical protein Q7O66_18140 [Dehalococcoidia bacterium]|nr:hypothetical protein [Dehalococcoidia bacterium]
MRRMLEANKLQITVWLATLVILALSAVLITQPGYMDAYYYHHVATNLASGRGLTEDYIWNYLPPPATLTHASNLYWMPLTSLIIVPFFEILGDSFGAAQVPFVLLASLLVLFTFRLSLWLTGNLRHALAASALTLFSGFYFAYWTSPDSFALFALMVNLALLMGFRSGLGGKGVLQLKEGKRTVTSTHFKGVWFAAAAGGLAALSHLTRADGVLVLGAVLVVIGVGAYRRGGSATEFDGRERTLSALMLVGACIVAYLVVMSPWFFRNWQLAGSILPTAGLRTLFLREYNDIFTYNRDLSWQSFIAWGLWPILKSKAEALGTNTMVLFGMEYHLVPFALIGLWSFRWKERPAFLPFFVYALTLYLTMSLLFTFPSGRGSMLHSSVALLPWLSLAAVVGLDRSIVWAAGRLRHWNVPLAQRNFTVILVFFATVFSTFLLVQEAGKRDERYRHYNQISAWFHESAPDSLIMIADPPGYYYSSGKGSIVIPSDDLDTVLLAARRYGATYIVVEKGHSRPLQPIYAGEKTDPRLQKMVEIDMTRIFKIGDR